MQNSRSVSVRRTEKKAPREYFTDSLLNRDFPKTKIFLFPKPISSTKVLTYLIFIRSMAFCARVEKGIVKMKFRQLEGYVVHFWGECAHKVRNTVKRYNFTFGKL